jgi:hypothetical protein
LQPRAEHGSASGRRAPAPPGKTQHRAHRGGEQRLCTGPGHSPTESPQSHGRKVQSILELTPPPPAARLCQAQKPEPQPRPLLPEPITTGPPILARDDVPRAASQRRADPTWRAAALPAERAAPPARGCCPCGAGSSSRSALSFARRGSNCLSVRQDNIARTSLLTAGG